MKIKPSRLIFIIINGWFKKTILAFVILLTVLLISTMNVEMIFSSRFLYSFMLSLIIFALFILTCSSVILMNFFLNLQVLLPHLEFTNFPSKKKVARESRLPVWQVFVLVKTHEDIVKTLNRS